MTPTSSDNSKIVNPQLSLGLLNASQPHGAFEIYVRLAEPSKHPNYMTVTGDAGPGLLKATIATSKIKKLSADRNVVAVELREFHSEVVQ